MAQLGMSKKSKYKQYKMNVNESIGYVGKEKQIRIMSSYEEKAIKICHQLFLAGRIKGWASEESVFGYHTPYEPDKERRYFMDLTLFMSDGRIVFVEIKPWSDTQNPRKPKNPKNPNAYQNAVKTYITNQSKWQSVRDWCEAENRKAGKNIYFFLLWTENELKIKK